MPDRRLLIHIGYHKTGSTALQEHFFAQESGFVRWQDDRAATHRSFVCLPAMAPLDRDVVAGVNREVEGATRLGGCFVISHERLSGYYATGGFDSAAIADRLQGGFPDARILIVIREQRAMLASAYSQYVSDGGVLPFKGFMRPPSLAVKRAPSFDPAHFAYDRLIGRYQSLFGSDRVLVLPFELLAREPEDFLRRIADHCGLAELDGDYGDGLPRTNDRRNVLVQGLVRHANRWLRSDLNPGGLIEGRRARAGLNLAATHLSRLAEPLTPRGLTARVRNRQRERIHALAVAADYASSNKRVEAMTGLALSQYGYFLPPAAGACGDLAKEAA